MNSKKPDVEKAGGSNDFQTPPWAVDLLLPYLPREGMIWEPAAGRGNIVWHLRGHGFNVVASDTLPCEWLRPDPSRECLRSQNDFLRLHSLPYFTSIVTNPPWSTKDKWLAQCYELGKPFALLLPSKAMGEQGRTRLYRQHGIQLLVPARRINFETPTGLTEETGSSAWMHCSWFCWGLNLPRDLVFCEEHPQFANKPARKRRKKKFVQLELFSEAA